MYPLNLPLPAPPPPALSGLFGLPALPGTEAVLAPVQTPLSSAEGPSLPFPNLLAALLPAASAVPLSADIVVPGPVVGHTGTELPDAAEPRGKRLPEEPGIPTDPVMPNAFIAPLVLPVVVTGHQPLNDTAPVRSPVPVLPKPSPVAEVLRAELPVLQEGDADLRVESAATPVAAREGGAAATPELAPLPLRAAEAMVQTAPAREPAPAPAPAPAQSPATVPLSAPGSQLEQLVEALAVAREAGKGARGDVTVRHAEFGLVAIRLEQVEGETRAQISGRDPGFAPAAIAALVDRGSAGLADHPQRSSEHPQRGSESGGGASTPGQPGAGGSGGRGSGQQPSDMVSGALSGPADSQTDTSAYDSASSPEARGRQARFA
jgi:hypothetical protein